MLIDFGSNHRTEAGGSLATVADLITQQTAGCLDVLIATHRHKDHISGFGDPIAAPKIAALKPARIIRPWTDDPNAPEHAGGPRRALSDNSRRFATYLRGCHTLAAAISERHANSRENAKRLSNLAAMQLPNPEAIRNLEDWAANSTARYVHADTTVQLLRA